MPTIKAIIAAGIALHSLPVCAAENYGAIDVTFEDGTRSIHFAPDALPINKFYVPHRQGATKRYWVGWQAKSAGAPDDLTIARMNASPDGSSPFGFMFAVTKDGKTRNYSAGCSNDTHYEPPCNEAAQGIVLDLKSGTARFNNVIFHRDSSTLDHEEQIKVNGELKILGTPTDE